MTFTMEAAIPSNTKFHTDKKYIALYNFEFPIIPTPRE